MSSPRKKDRPSMRKKERRLSASSGVSAGTGAVACETGSASAAEPLRELATALLLSMRSASVVAFATSSGLGGAGGAARAARAGEQQPPWQGGVLASEASVARCCRRAAALHCGALEAVVAAEGWSGAGVESRGGVAGGRSGEGPPSAQSMQVVEAVVPPPQAQHMVIESKSASS